MLIFITDLDGTLLDDGYSFQAALPALEALQRLHIPLVLCTSKTYAEVKAFRRQIGNRDPFIVENGGALYIPEGCLPLELNSPIRRGGCTVIELGHAYPELIRSLHQASNESGCAVRGFHQMSVEEISLACGMTPEAARLAKIREYDEPFEILSGDPRRLIAAIDKRKKRCTRGGRFYHILGANDKSHCVNLLIHYYSRAFGSATTVGLGDGPNDAGFLKLVDAALVMKSPASEQVLASVPHARLCPGDGGPAAWNSAVLSALVKHLPAGQLSVERTTSSSNTSKAAVV
jgi:mannosyl-3-phosphoglycerate phosphatase